MSKKSRLRIFSILALLIILAIAIPAVPAQAQVQLTLSPTSGPVGTVVNVTAYNFTGLTTTQTVSQIVAVYFGATEVATFNYDVTFNRVQGYFIVPDTLPVGIYPVELKYGYPNQTVGPFNGTVVLQYQMNFNITQGTTTTTTPPAINLSPTTGLPSSVVTITGNHFSPQSTIYIYFDNISAKSAILTDSSGNFNTTFSVPVGKEAGSHDVRVDDSQGKTASATFQVQAELLAFISENNGGVGTKENIAGKGFKPNTKITVKFDNTTIPDIVVSTDSGGAFTSSFVIPVAKGGNHKITVSDGTNTKEFAFAMETTPPPAPVLQSPANNAVLEDEVYFNWSDVSDNATGDSEPVIYALQISTDPSFETSTIVLEKKDLKQSELALSNAERDDLVPVKTATEPVPKDKKYYWRVMATDSASNEGSWARSAFVIPAPAGAEPAPTEPNVPTTPLAPPGTTSPNTTATETGSSVFGLPSWAIYALFALIAVLFLFIGLYLGRKSAYG